MAANEGAKEAAAAPAANAKARPVAARGLGVARGNVVTAAPVAARGKWTPTATDKEN